MERGRKARRTRLVNIPDTRVEARILSKSRYEPRLRATPRKRVVYEPRALSSELAPWLSLYANVHSRLGNI